MGAAAVGVGMMQPATSRHGSREASWAWPASGQPGVSCKVTAIEPARQG